MKKIIVYAFIFALLLSSCVKQGESGQITVNYPEIEGDEYYVKMKFTVSDKDGMPLNFTDAGKIYLASWDLGNGMQMLNDSYTILPPTSDGEGSEIIIDFFDNEPIYKEKEKLIIENITTPSGKITGLWECEFELKTPERGRKFEIVNGGNENTDFTIDSVFISHYTVHINGTGKISEITATVDGEDKPVSKGSASSFNEDTKSYTGTYVFYIPVDVDKISGLIIDGTSYQVKMSDTF